MIFAIKFNLLQEFVNILKFYAKIQNPKGLAKFILSFPRPSISTSAAIDNTYATPRFIITYCLSFFHIFKIESALFFSTKHVWNP